MFFSMIYIDHLTMPPPLPVKFDNCTFCTWCIVLRSGATWPSVWPLNILKVLWCLPLSYATNIWLTLCQQMLSCLKRGRHSYVTDTGQIQLLWYATPHTCNIYGTDERSRFQCSELGLNYLQFPSFFFSFLKKN